MVVDMEFCCTISRRLSRIVSMHVKVGWDDISVFQEDEKV